jgi:hypothetical protein
MVSGAIAVVGPVSIPGSVCADGEVRRHEAVDREVYVGERVGGGTGTDEQ